MQPIETLTGAVNLRTASAKCFVFHVPRQGGAGIEERMLRVASASPQTSAVIARLSSHAQVTPAVSGYSIEIGGSMTRESFAVADGEIIKLFVSRRPGAGQLPLTACQLLRIRGSAALRAIEATMLTDPRVVNPLATLRGRFDLLTYEEAIALGARLNANFAKFFNPAVVEKCMTVQVIEAEQAQAKVVVPSAPASIGAPSGIAPTPQAVVVVETKRRRKLGGF